MAGYARSVSAAAPVIVVVVVFLLVAWGQRTLSQGVDYQCGSCGYVFNPSPAAAALAPHRFGGFKLLRCPDCGALTWASAVPK